MSVFRVDVHQAEDSSDGGHEEGDPEYLKKVDEEEDNDTDKPDTNFAKVFDNDGAKEEETVVIKSHFIHKGDGKTTDPKESGENTETITIPASRRSHALTVQTTTFTHRRPGGI